MKENETPYHFFGRCPILKCYRLMYFKSEFLDDEEVINFLNGKNWIDLVNYVISAGKYRKELINEFNV